MEGSVDEESTKSDEEYDDLAMQDIQENGYLNAEFETKINVSGVKQNVDCVLRTKSEPLMDKRLASRVRGRSYSISGGSHG